MYIHLEYTIAMCNPFKQTQIHWLFIFPLFPRHVVLMRVWCGRFVPVCVVRRQRVGNVVSGQQEESPEEVNDAAGGQEEEGGAERDASLVQQLQEMTSRSISAWTAEAVFLYTLSSSLVWNGDEVEQLGILPFNDSIVRLETAFILKQWIVIFYRHWDTMSSCQE